MKSLACLMLLAGTAAAAPRVIILKSADLAAYDAPARSFRDELAARLPGAVIEERDMRGERARGEEAVREAGDAALFFAVGAKAAVVAARESHGVPVVFTAVLDWSSYRALLGQPHVAGVALEVPADAQLARAKFLSPDLRRVVVVTRSRRGGARLDELVEAGRRLRLEVVPLALDELDGLRRYANEDAFTTAVLPLADPVVYGGERFLELAARARGLRLPLLAYSEKYVEAGAVLSVGVNYADLGAQAALVAEQILGGTPPATLGVAAPVGTSLALNQAAARAIELTPPDALVRMVDRLFTTVGELEPPSSGALDRPPPDDPRALAGEADPFAEVAPEEGFFAAEEDIVRVAARRRQRVSEAPSIVSVWSGEELAALGVRSLAEALQLLPGVTARYTRLGSWDLLFRGVNQPADLLVLIDGQRVNSMYDGTVSYDLPVEDIARVEVIRGPGSALYGTNALSGVISVVTRHRTRFALSLRGELLPGGHAAGGFHGRFGGSTRRFDFDASLTIRPSQGAKLTIAQDVGGAFDTPRRLDDGKRYGGLFLRFGLRGVLGAGSTLVFDPKLIFESRGPNFGPTETLAPDSTLVRQLAVLPLELGLPLGQRLALRLRASLSRLDIREDLQIRPDGFTDRANPMPAPDGLGNRTRYGVDEFALEPQLALELPRAPIWQRHLLTVGALAEQGTMTGFSYDQNYLDQDGTLQYYGNFSAARVAELGELGIAPSGFQNYNQFKLAQKDADRTVLSAYAQSEIQLPHLPLGDVWLTAGLRVDRFSDFRTEAERKTYTTVNPRAALVWAPLTRLSLKLMYGRAFRAPSFQELYDATRKVNDQFFQIPNEDLRPEKTRVAELGVEARPLRGITLRGNVYHIATDGNLDFDPTFNPAGVQVINFPGRDVLGYELELWWRPTANDLAFVNVSGLTATQRGDCVRREADGSCTGDANILSHDITDIPRLRVNAGASVRPLGLGRELAGHARGSALERLALSMVFHHVGPSRSNARVTFEQLNLPFRHPGYDQLDVGVTYPFSWKGRGHSAALFVTNVLGAVVNEPLVLTLEPHPREGYFLPRPRRQLMLRLEMHY